MKEIKIHQFEYYLSRFGLLAVVLLWIVFSGDLDVAMYLTPPVIGFGAVLLGRRVRFRRQILEKETKNTDRAKWTAEQWAYLRETQILQQIMIPLTWVTFAVFVAIAIIKTI